MGERLYDRQLECGCLISSDCGGTTIPCYAEWSDMSDPENVKWLELHNECWDKWMKSKDYKKHLKEIESSPT